MHLSVMAPSPDPPALVIPVSPVPTRWRVHLIRFAIALAIVLAFQAAFHAFADDFSGTADEPSHFLNGLLARDYARSVLSGALDNPMDFALDYYLHYPKVAIGNWPPGYPAISGFWMLLLGAGRVQGLLLIALFAAASATLLWTLAEQCLPPWPAALGAFLFVVLAPAVEHMLHVVLEWPLLFFGLLAAYSAIRAVRTGSHAASAVLAISVAAAIMVKGNAWALVPATLGALLTVRRLRVLWNWPFAIAACVSFGLAAGFYLLTLESATHVMKTRPLDWAWISSAFLFYVSAMSRNIGPAYMALAALGVLVVVRNQFRLGLSLRECNPVWIFGAWWIAATFVFHLFVTIGPEWRYLGMAAPFVALFAARGVYALFSLPAYSPLRIPAALAAIVLVAASVAGTLRLPVTPRGGFRAAASEIQRLTANTANKAVLITGDATVEGRAVAQAALGDPHHELYALRGSKILASDDWIGTSYRPLFASTRDTAAQLDRIPVSVLVIHYGDSARATHERQIEAIAKDPASGWTLQKHWDLGYGNSHETIEVYWNAANARRPIESFRVDLSQKIGRSVEYSPHHTLK